MVVLPAPFGPRKPSPRRASEEADVVDGGEAAIAFGESFDCDHGDQRVRDWPTVDSAAGRTRATKVGVLATSAGSTHWSRVPTLIPWATSMYGSSSRIRSAGAGEADTFQPPLTRWGHTLACTADGRHLGHRHGRGAAERWPTSSPWRVPVDVVPGAGGTGHRAPAPQAADTAAVFVLVLASLLGDCGRSRSARDCLAGDPARVWELG